MEARQTDAFSVAQRIVETLHEPLLVLDEEFCVERANPAFYRTFETSPEETVGVCLYDLGSGEWDVPELREHLDRVVEADTKFEGFEVDRRFPGLGRRVLRLNGRTLQRRRGESRRVLLAMEDVTDQLRLEEKLQHHVRELERSNADLEQFAYAASHDLQEPLRMVASYLELLERRYRGDLDEEAREFIDYTVDGARRMKGLINGLLEYSRVGRKEGPFDDVDLDDLPGEVLADLERRIGDLEAEVTREPLPTVRGNADQLRRVLQNLVDNALTYHGDAPPRIHVAGEERPDGTVHLTVRDHGPGIPPEARERIFQIFQQLEPHGEGPEGSGMGLALCRKIVERHGGTIRVESEPGEGATFHVTLSPDSEEVA